MTEQSFTAEQLEQAARAILIDHKYSISDIKDQYKQQIYEALKERNLEQLNQKLQDAKNMDDCSYIAFVREKE